MSQFKVGDRVRVRSPNEPEWKRSRTVTWLRAKECRINTVGTVKYVDRVGDVKVDFGDRKYYFAPSQLAPADEPPKPSRTAAEILKQIQADLAVVVAMIGTSVPGGAE